ncbi:GntR family transcriptional regulator [Erwinia sp. MMLR14_017]|uniref:GntR family transcriptional regulator n=1 Tax=Erwinia sp. MMLR14_017 TaxID=3093842 RepID=UPI00298F84C3|nr:GntR family transcriptional regulator [Erwinia sp. MMLR14_017]MDW8845517.1 GntR family transcriptional regulator [Erwinia sp. MMLR14_017]
MSAVDAGNIKKSLSFIAYEKIKDRILNMEISPGSSLTEMWLIEQLGMSRTPIREALYRLQQESFVELAPRKGWFVAEIKLRDIQELFMIREALEGISTRNATHRLSDEQLHHMQHYLASLEASLLKDEAAVSDPGDSLHEMIFACIDNHYVNNIMANYIDRLRQFHIIASRLPGRKLQSYYEHCDIFQALLARDENRAEQAMRQHIQSSMNSILDCIINKTPLYGQSVSVSLSGTL